ncbi:MAG: RNA-binding protein [Anaerolineae bacterium]|nr:RNA-binding protein [Anaerolineae bacterium]
MTQNVYVGNLSYDTGEEKLRTLFGEYGEVESVRLITDRDTGRSKGFAFVEMSTEDAAKEAIEALNGQEIDGREIRVDKAQPRREGGGGGDRRRGGGGRQRRW